MSITPIHTQGSNSSSSLLPLTNPNFNHGSFFSLPQSQSISRSVEDSQLDSMSLSGHVEPGSRESAGASNTASEIGTSSGDKGLFDESIRTVANRHGEIGSLQSRGKLSGTAGSSRNNKSNGSNNPHDTTHPAGRKNQSINGNHLLNFHYNPITRPQARTPPHPRRQHKLKPYNKDLFLQANYKFVVLDSGQHTPETMDPDKMLNWEDIICLRYSTPFPVQCPICLDHPLVPQITSCGHIFCFPCILQYLLMGDVDNTGNCSKRCPLCFLMISPKDLYTITIENVKQYSVGDTIEFMLLNRQKDSSTISPKNKLEIDDALSSCNNTVYDSFAKITFTSDVELSVREAISDLDSWLVKADSGLVDDIEKLPYVCAAMEQLELRKKYWNEARSSYGNKNTGSQTGSKEAVPTPNANNFHHDGGFAEPAHSNNISDQNKRINKLTSDVLDGGNWSPKCDEEVQSLASEDKQPTSNGVTKSFRGYLEDSRDIKDEYSYNFYQAVDGQHLILHPLNMKCLLHHYGNTDMLPHRITGKILQFETVTQTEAMRKRYKYLSHFSLTTTFQLCEIDMSQMLPPAALSSFMDEIKKRQNQRKRLAIKEEKEKNKAEAVSGDYYVAVRSNTEPFNYGDSPKFTVDDFEALGNSSATSTSPPTVWGGTLFSNVTRLGYAAAHDSPSLKINGAHCSQSTETSPALAAGSANAGGLSFAKVLSKNKTKETTDAPKMNESGKKGKKPSRVLLSTSGGRRY